MMTQQMDNFLCTKSSLDEISISEFLFIRSAEFQETLDPPLLGVWGTPMLALYVHNKNKKNIYIIRFAPKGSQLNYNLYPDPSLPNFSAFQPK